MVFLKHKIVYTTSSIKLVHIGYAQYVFAEMNYFFFCKISSTEMTEWILN